jgi:hypothetical protein
MMSPADHIAQLECVVRDQMAEIDQLRAAIGQKDQELDAVVAWIAGDEDALGTLRSVYVDPRTSVPNKVKAASSALPFERSKPASVTVIVDFKSRVHDARMQTVELRKAEWTRQPVLGSDHGPEPAA